MSLTDKKVILLGGPGGVGKTTLAASLAVKLAEEGHATVVLTVDPARRLAQALGIEGFKKDLEEVPLGSGKLWASMLDTQRYFDRIIEKFAKTPTQKEKIVNNPIYRTMVDSLGGTHEYAAMERLSEFLGDSRFDKIIVDTPPTQNAVDLLRAPQRLADFMDNTVLKWFQKSSPSYLRFFQKGTKLAMKIFEKLFGSDFLDSLGELMDDFEGMQQGFKQRHEALLKLLQSDQTAFCLVTSASESRFSESLQFADTLKASGVNLEWVALNRVENPPPPLSDLTGVATESREEVERWLQFQQGSFEHQQRWIREFERVMKVPVKKVPLRTQAPTDIAALSQIGSLLVE